jgi:hypothetical protein
MVETQKNKKKFLHYACQYGNSNLIHFIDFCAKTIYKNNKFNIDKLLFEQLQTPYTYYYDFLYTENTNSQNIKWKLQCIKLANEITYIKFLPKDFKSSGD